MNAFLASSLVLASFSFLASLRVNAQSRTAAELGQVLLDKLYADLMRTCSAARAFNRAGKMYCNHLMTEMVNDSRLGGSSYEQRVFAFNGLAWAMRRVCPDVQ